MGKRVETWKAIPGYEGLYECSDLGNVRSLDRTVEYRDGRKPRFWPGKILSPAMSETYLAVTLHKAGRRWSERIQRLVLLTFVGPPPGRADACHNNGRRTDNRLCNLRWDTRAKNLRDRIEHGTLLRGETHSMVKLTEAQVREIRDLRGKASCRRLGEMFGVSPSMVCNIHIGKNWTHVA